MAGRGSKEKKKSSGESPFGREKFALTTSTSHYTKDDLAFFSLYLAR